jgi:hypothetical protein
MSVQLVSWIRRYVDRKVKGTGAKTKSSLLKELGICLKFVLFLKFVGASRRFYLIVELNICALLFDAFTDENSFRPFYRFYCKEEITIQKIIDFLERQAFTWT